MFILWTQKLSTEDKSRIFYDERLLLEGDNEYSTILYQTNKMLESMTFQKISSEIEFCRRGKYTSFSSHFEEIDVWQRKAIFSVIAKNITNDEIILKLQIATNKLGYTISPAIISMLKQHLAKRPGFFVRISWWLQNIYDKLKSVIRLK